MPYDWRKNSPNEVVYDHTIRCPECGYLFSASRHKDDWEFYTVGSHEVHCPDCAFSFFILVEAILQFRSPPLGESEPY